MLSKAEINNYLETGEIIIRPLREKGTKYSEPTGTSVKISKRDAEEGTIGDAVINLTASCMAWSVKRRISVVKNKFIIIRPGDTVVILSEEFFYLGKKFAGYCVSRVRYSSHGLTSISSPVKPHSIGKFVISFTNTSKKKFTIPVGQKIAMLSIHELDGETSDGDYERHTFVTDKNEDPGLLEELKIVLSNKESLYLGRCQDITKEDLVNDNLPTISSSEHSLRERIQFFLKINWGKIAAVLGVSATIIGTIFAVLSFFKS